MNKQKQIFAFIGTSVADAHLPGVMVCRFNQDTGSLEMVSKVDGLKKPTFLDIDPVNHRVYAICDESDESGQGGGGVAAYQFNPADGSLTLLNKEKTVAGPTCHIVLDRTIHCLMVASYHGGMVGLSPVLEDGRVGRVSDIHQHSGSSVLPVQSQARPHSVFIDPDNKFAVVSDLGLDLVKIYRLDIPGLRMIPHGQVATAPGAGPRHFAFHPKLACGYVINELNSTIIGYDYDRDRGILTEKQTVGTLPVDAQGIRNACADIHISPDGRFLYGSNRGHDSIAVFAIHPADGKLTLVEHVSTAGKHPRNFALSPDGAFLLVANQDTNNIVSFARDPATGKLKQTEGAPFTEAEKPVCIQFLTL